MFGVRDLVWSAIICGVLSYFVQCRPAMSARRFVERECDAAFEQAYAGHRYLNGEIVGSGGGYVDPMAPAVVLRRLEIEAQEGSWNGKRAEFVVRHLVQLGGTGADGTDASHDIHLRLERRDARWVYTLFQVRGQPPLDDPGEGNPFARAFSSTSAQGS